MHLLANLFMRAKTALSNPLMGNGVVSHQTQSSKSIFFLTCRILVAEGEEQHKYRATYLVRRPRYVEAEEIAEQHLQEFLSQHPSEFGKTREIRWLKGRLISNHPRQDETDTTRRLLSELRKGSHEFVSAIERVDSANGTISSVSAQAFDQH